jgi:hypothetical protein
MADPIEVKKWFHEGPVDAIDQLKWRLMTPKHRQLYNLFRRLEQLEVEKAEIEELIAAESIPILDEIRSNPDSPLHRWSWWEILKRPHVKWAQEFEAALGKAEADRIRATYKSKEFVYLRVQYIHPRPPESK